MTAPDLDRTTIVPFLADIFARRGDEEYLGEDVTMSEHMLQAATFAEEQGEPDEIVVAALLHDIGHFTSEFGSFSMADTKDRHHEEAGANVLAAFFPSVVTDCVRQHVAAKRYLCAVEQPYFDALSDASVHSLKLQGGPMSQEEVVEFRSQPNASAIVRVRRFDDQGKVAGMETPGFEHFVPKIQRVIDDHLTVA